MMTFHSRRQGKVPTPAGSELFSGLLTRCQSAQCGSRMIAVAGPLQQLTMDCNSSTTFAAQFPQPAGHLGWPEFTGEEDLALECSCPGSFETDSSSTTTSRTRLNLVRSIAVDRRPCAAASAIDTLNCCQS